MLPIFAYKKLYPSLREHRQAEQLLLELLPSVLDDRYLRPAGKGFGNPLKYAQKNFFSILFLAIYRAIGLPPERRVLYGAVNHCLRGIVTGTDNLLDDEYKELLPLAFPEQAVRFKSVMHILLFDRFLSVLAGRLGQCFPQCDVAGLQDGLLRALVPIGAEEAGEEGGVDGILTPAEILSSIHMYKGGKLLCLAFVAPRFLEQHYAHPLRQAESGIYHIGMALQMLDDCTDLYEDIRARNHNYLVAAIYHDGTPAERQVLSDLLANRRQWGDGIETLFPETVRRVMGEAIGEALTGFSLLEETGFWCSRQQANALIRHLFVLRGLSQLLPFYPDDSATPGPPLHSA